MLVVCNGMIRAGSTLQYNLAVALVESLGEGTAEGYFDSRKYAVLDRRLPDWRRDTKRHVIKTHEIYPAMLEDRNPDDIRGLYIFRDIRDVAASAKLKWGYSDEALLDAVNTAIQTYDKLHRLPIILCQRYEDVMASPHTAVAQIANWLSLKASPRLVQQVVDQTSLNKAQNVIGALNDRVSVRMVSKINRTLRVGIDNYDRKTLLHLDHISDTQGRSGVWRAVLTASEAEAVNDRFGPWLKAAGYPHPG